MPLPSNTGEDDELKPQFNSIGYYSALLNRLNDQIGTVEEVYKTSFHAARQQQEERELRSARQMSPYLGRKYSLHEL